MNDKELREAVLAFNQLKLVPEEYEVLCPLKELVEQVLSAEMPTRATTLGAEDNKADINGWNACYDAFIAYLAHKKLGQEEKIRGVLELMVIVVLQECKRNIEQGFTPITFVDFSKDFITQALSEIMEVV